MSTQVIYSSIGVWFAIVAALMLFAALAGVPDMMSICALAVVVGLVPPAMMLRLSAVDP
jgi:hypothetical protein